MTICPEPRLIMASMKALVTCTDAVIIDVHLPVKDGEVQLLELAGVCHAGAVHQVIGRAVILDEFIGHLFDLGRVGYIRLERTEFLTWIDTAFLERFHGSV